MLMHEKPCLIAILQWKGDNEILCTEIIEHLTVVMYRVFDYFKHHYFHVYYRFLYINRTFWRNMFTITSCVLFLIFQKECSGLSYFWYVIQHLEDSLPNLEK